VTPATAPARRAVFLDRDGTILDELGYLSEPERVRLLPGAAEALARLSAAGLALVVVTNQSGVARGRIEPAALERVHRRMEELLAEHDVRLDAILACPHHPDVGEPPYRTACDCRKPAPGLILRGAEALGADLGRSFVVGDSARDLEAGARAGVPHRFLVATGKGPEAHEALVARGEVDHVYVRDLAAAADAILARAARGQGR